MALPPDIKADFGKAQGGALALFQNTGADLVTPGESFAEYQRRDDLDKVRQVLVGNVSGDAVSSRSFVNSFMAALREADLAEQQEKEKDGDRYFLLLVSKLNDEIARLQDEMDGLAEQLKAKYGEDYISGIADTYLSPEELAGLSTREEKLRALADKFLDEDGKIRPEYANTPEAQYVYRWNRKERLEALTNNIEKGEKLKPEDKAIIKELVGEDNAQHIMKNNAVFDNNKEAATMSEEAAENKLAAKSGSDFSYGGG